MSQHNESSVSSNSEDESPPCETVSIWREPNDEDKDSEEDQVVLPIALSSFDVSSMLETQEITSVRAELKELLGKTGTLEAELTKLQEDLEKLNREREAIAVECGELFRRSEGLDSIENRISAIYLACNLQSLRCNAQNGEKKALILIESLFRIKERAKTLRQKLKELKQKEEEEKMPDDEKSWNATSNRMENFVLQFLLGSQDDEDK